MEIDIKTLRKEIDAQKKRITKLENIVIGLVMRNGLEKQTGQLWDCIDYLLKPQEEV